MTARPVSWPGAMVIGDMGSCKASPLRTAESQSGMALSRRKNDAARRADDDA